VNKNRVFAMRRLRVRSPSAPWFALTLGSIDHFLASCTIDYEPIIPVNPSAARLSQTSRRRTVFFLPHRRGRPSWARRKLPQARASSG
jgi:hypothetical protein